MLYKNQNEEYYAQPGNFLHIIFALFFVEFLVFVCLVVSEWKLHHIRMYECGEGQDQY